MNSKLELRNMAVNSALNVEGVTADNVIAVAESIYNFVLGEAELPEKYDPNAQMETMAKLAGMMNLNKSNNEGQEIIKEADFAEESSDTAEAV